MEEKNSVTLADVKAAAERIAPYIRRTQLLREPLLDKDLGCEVYLKPEMLQYTGAFKLRGALAKTLALTPEQRAKGIICSSSGNHAQACAYAGRLLGFRSVAVVPEDTPEIKIALTENMGGEIIKWDRSYQARWKKVREEVAEHGYTMVHGYEDYTVMAGQGTIALEVMEDLPELETMVVPIGGGGLISGIATAIKETNPKIRVVGVQAAASASNYYSRKEGHIVRVENQPTLADGIECCIASEVTYPIIEKYVDEIVIVEEDDIAKAVTLIGDKAKLVAEPTSCVVIAALMAKTFSVRPDEKVCALLTSGNWDIDLVGKLYKGEHVDGVC